MDINEKIVQKPGEDDEESPKQLKRHASQCKHSEESPPKRSKLLNDLVKKKVSLADMECLIQKLTNKFDLILN